jgi:hypothetical protein
MSFTRLLAGAAAFAVAVTTANAADMPVKAPAPVPVAQQLVSGYLEVYGGWASTKFRHTLCNPGPVCFQDNWDFNGWVLGGAGRANVWLGSVMSMQLDAQAEGTQYKNDHPFFRPQISNHSYLIGGHANFRNAQTGLIGVFAGAGDAGGGFNEAVRHVVVGGEGQLYWNQLTLYVQGGYDFVVGTPASNHLDSHAWFIRGTGRYFFLPNTMLEGTVLYADGEVKYDGLFVPASGRTNPFTTWLWEVKLEHRFTIAPVAAFVKYRGSRTEFDPITFGVQSDELKVTDQRVLLGLKVLMGTDTLQGNDRRGATLDIIDPLGIQSGPLMIGGTQALRP